MDTPMQSTNTRPASQEKIEFFFDLGSPFSYIASTQLEGLAERTGVEIEWRPFLLAGVFKSTGNNTPYYEKIASKRTWILDDLQRWPQHYGVPFNFPSNFPLVLLTAMRGAVAARRLGALVPYSRAMYTAYFVNDENPSEREVVVSVAQRMGLDGDDFSALLDDPEVKVALRRASDEAVERGAFGAPTFFWRDQMFFGNDRVALLESFVIRSKDADQA